MSTQVEAVQSKPSSTGGTSGPTRRSLWLTLIGSVIFWAGLPFPVVTDFFESENEAAEIAAIEASRGQFAVAFGLLGLGAAIAGAGVYLLARSIAPAERARSSRRGTAAAVAAWLAVTGCLAGLSRLIHAPIVAAKPSMDTPADMIVGGVGYLGMSLSMMILGVLAWAGPPRKWIAVVMFLGGLAGLVTFLPLFWYAALIVVSLGLLRATRRSVAPTSAPALA